MESFALAFGCEAESLSCKIAGTVGFFGAAIALFSSTFIVLSVHLACSWLETVSSFSN